MTVTDNLFWAITSGLLPVQQREVPKGWRHRIRVAWSFFLHAIFYGIELLIFLALFRKFSHPFEVALIALFGLTTTTITHQVVVIRRVFLDFVYLIEHNVLAIVHLIAYTADQQVKADAGYDPQWFFTQTGALQQFRQRNKSDAATNANLFFLIVIWWVCAYNLLWSIDWNLIP